MLLPQVSQVMERIEVTASGPDPLPRQLQVASCHPGGPHPDPARSLHCVTLLQAGPVFYASPN
jgi:hypothetical protein